MPFQFNHPSLRSVQYITHKYINTYDHHQEYIDVATLFSYPTNYGFYDCND